VFVTFRAGRSQLYVRALDQLEAQPLQVGNFPRGLFMSPDGNWLGFFDEPNVLRKVTVNGGPAVTICSVSGGPRGASWGPDNTIVFATNDPATGLFRVSAAGGEADVLTKPDGQKGELDHYWPELLPGGEAVLFTILPTRGGIENAQIAVLDLQTGEQRVLVPGGSHPRYVPTGHIVYGVAGTLRAVAFDLGRLEVRSDPVPVLQRVVTKPSGAASFSVALDGSLVYLAGDYQSGTARTLMWVDRQGREEAIKAPPRSYASPRISPDGTRVAVDASDQEQDIWIWDLRRQTLTRFTFDPAYESSPLWTPDGRRIVFSSARAGAANLFWQAADGTGPVERKAPASLDVAQRAKPSRSCRRRSTRGVGRSRPTADGWRISRTSRDSSKSTCGRSRT
jgi:serine/threonine-protein kinase